MAFSMVAAPAARAAFDACIVYGDSQGSTGDQDFNLPTGFGTPTAVIIFGTTAYFDGLNPHHQARMAIGFSDGSTDRGVVAQSRDARIASDTYRRKSTSYSVITMTAGFGSVRDEGSVSFGTDKVTITWANADASGLGLIIIAFTGTDGVWVGDLTHDYDSDGVTKATTSPGFEPDVIFMATTETANAATGSANAKLTFGAAVNDGSLTQRSIAFGSPDNLSPSESHMALWTDAIVKPVLSGSTAEEGIAISDFLSNGFETTIDTASTGKSVDECIVLAIDLPDGKGAFAQTHAVTTGTPPINQTIISGLDSAPSVTIVAGTILPTAGVMKTDNTASCFGLGAAYNDGTTTTEAMMSYRDQDARGGIGTETVTWNQVAESEVYFVEDYDGTDDNYATTYSYDSGGMTWTWGSNATPGLRFFTVAFADLPPVTVLDYERGTRGLLRGMKVGMWR